MNAQSELASFHATSRSVRAADTVVSDALEPNRRRVLVIDNFLLTAQAVVLALTQLDFSARFTLPVAATEFASFGTWRPQVALLDVDSVTAGASLACVRTMRDSGIPIAVMTSNVETVVAGESMRLGAASVVHKAAPLSQLVQVISGILDGDDVIRASLRQHVVKPNPRLAAFNVLTNREKYVLSQLMVGESAEAIANGASVSISTVRSQIKAILQKLGVNSQLAAASLARQVGWTYIDGDGAATSASA